MASFDKVLTKVFGSSNERFLKAIRPTIAQINEFGAVAARQVMSASLFFVCAPGEDHSIRDAVDEQGFVFCHRNHLLTQYHV